MTIVCCWFQDGLSPSSIVIASDSRASILTTKNKWIPYTDDLTKIHLISINCRHLPEIAAPDEKWPIYFSTTFLVGFSGDVFEAMAVISLAKRFFRRLTSSNKAAPRPTFKEAANCFASIAKTFRARRHHQPDANLSFLLVGYCPQTSRPSGALVECKDKETYLTHFSLEPAQPWMIGDAANRAECSSRELQDRIKKSRAVYASKYYDKLDADVEIARRGHAMSKQLEQEIIDAIDEKFKVTIGGHLDKGELFYIGAGVGAADLTHGNIASGDVLSTIEAMADGQLYYMHVTQQTGRK